MPYKTLNLKVDFHCRFNFLHLRKLSSQCFLFYCSMQVKQALFRYSLTKNYIEEYLKAFNLDVGLLYTHLLHTQSLI